MSRKNFFFVSQNTYSKVSHYLKKRRKNTRKKADNGPVLSKEKALTFWKYWNWRHKRKLHRRLISMPPVFQNKNKHGSRTLRQNLQMYAELSNYPADWRALKLDASPLLCIGHHGKRRPLEGEVTLIARLMQGRAAKTSPRFPAIKYTISDAAPSGRH